MKSISLRIKLGLVAAVACSASLVIPVHASVIITYKDAGSNIQFDYSGSLGFSTTATTNSNTYGAVGIFAGTPIFYSTGDTSHGYTGNHPVIVTDDSWGLTLPVVSSLYSATAQSGTALMFRLGLDGGGAGIDNMQIWGDWGAANTNFTGSLSVSGSIASFGMVDNYQIFTSGGSITFNELGTAPPPIPEPSSSALLGLSGFALMLRRRRLRNFKQFPTVTRLD
jgi:hypothetical protein